MLSPAVDGRRENSSSNSVLETKMEVNRFDRRPKHRVVAKPRIGPVLGRHIQHPYYKKSPNATLLRTMAPKLCGSTI